jgi:iron(III) transport system permease protein
MFVSWKMFKTYTIDSARVPALLGSALLAAVLIILVAAPLGNILLQAISDGHGTVFSLTARNLQRVLSEEIYWTALVNTLLVCGGAAVGATVLGTALAWIFVRTDTFGRSILEQISQIPIFIPPFVGAVAWALLFAPRVGAGNRILAAFGVPVQFDIYTRAGMLLVMSIYLAPYVMMMVAAAMRGVDPSLEEAAQVSGLSRLRTALQITVPLLSPAILSGAVIAFTIAVGLFGTPVVIGWSRQILLLTSRIWISTQEVPPDYGVTAVLSLYLIFLSILATAAQRYVLANRSFITITGKGYRPRPIALGPWMFLTSAVAVLYIVLTILAPLVVLVAAALSTYTWSGRYSLENVWAALDTQDVWLTLKNSLYISIVSATLATAMGIVIAWIINRTRFRGRRFLEYFVLLPIAVPGIAFGIGVMLTWIGSSLPVYGTSLIIMFAFVGRFTAYAVRSISSSLVQLHPELEESARVFGYGPFRTFAQISFPLILPSVLAGWVLLFSFFITELSMVILLYSASNRMFSILSFEIWNVGDFSKLAALSLLQTLIGLTLAIVLKSVFRNTVNMG